MSKQQQYHAQKWTIDPPSYSHVTLALQPSPPAAAAEPPPSSLVPLPPRPCFPCFPPFPLSRFHFYSRGRPPPRLPAGMAASPKPPKVVPPRRDATGVARRTIGRDHWKVDCPAKLCSQCQGRGHTADVWPVSAEKRCNRCKGPGHAADICPSSEKEAVLAVSNDDSDDGTVQSVYSHDALGRVHD